MPLLGPSVRLKITFLSLHFAIHQVPKSLSIGICLQAQGPGWMSLVLPLQEPCLYPTQRLGPTAVQSPVLPLTSPSSLGRDWPLSHDLVEGLGQITRPGTGAARGRMDKVNETHS